MRLASWVFVACAALGAIGVFVPSLELRLGGVALARRTSLSLYQANGTRAFATRLIVGYQRADAGGLGRGALAAFAGRVGGGLGSTAGDAGDALTEVAAVDADQAHSIGTAVMVGLWSFLLLHLVMAGLVFTDVVDRRYRRRRAIGAVVIAVLVAAAAIAIHVACRIAVREANAELGRAVVGLAAGAYLIPVAGVGAVAAGVTRLVLARRRTP